MLIDSQIWKYELKNELSKFQGFIQNTDLNSLDQMAEYEEEFEEYNQVSNNVFIKLQKFTIYASIIIRKLIEAEKISDELLKENFTFFLLTKVNQRKVTKFNAFEIEDLYDLDSPKKANINLKDLTDRIIHSFHFMPKYDWSKCDPMLPDEEFENWKNDGLEGFYFSSDRTKDKELYYISIDVFTQIINETILDNTIRKKYIGGKLIVNSRTIENQ